MYDVTINSPIGRNGPNMGKQQSSSAPFRSGIASATKLQNPKRPHQEINGIWARVSSNAGTTTCQCQTHALTQAQDHWSAEKAYLLAMFWSMWKGTIGASKSCHAPPYNWFEILWSMIWCQGIQNRSRNSIFQLSQGLLQWPNWWRELALAPWFPT